MPINYISIFVPTWRGGFLQIQPCKSENANEILGQVLFNVDKFRSGQTHFLLCYIENVIQETSMRTTSDIYGFKM